MRTYVKGETHTYLYRDREEEVTEVGNNVKFSYSVFLSYRRSVLSAAIKRPNAATVNQRLSWVFQELNLFFLFLEVKSPSVPRTPKEAAAAVIQGK